jgi:class 3 adenylate cyclase
MASQAESGSASAVDDMKRLHAAVVEKETTASSFRSFVPEQVAERIAGGDGGVVDQRELEVTVLFSDIRGFSTIAERLSAREIADVVGKHLTAMAEVVIAHGGTIDKFQGDAVMAIFGAPEPILDHAVRALRCAIAMQSRQAELNAEGWGSEAVDGPAIGLNTGTVVPAIGEGRSSTDGDA